MSCTLPCFHLSSEIGVLPSFGAFTGGARIRRRPGDRVFVVAGDGIMEA